MLIALLVFSGCNKDKNETEAPTDEVTWHQDVAPILSENCVGCHSNGGLRQETPLGSHADVEPLASVVAGMVRGDFDLQMPPFFADETEECTPRFPWRDDARLSEAEIQIISDWSEGGALEGDPETAAELPDPISPQLANADAPLTPATYTTRTADEIEDEFACFVFDPQLTEDGWLEGVQVIPGNDRVVHHVIVSTDPELESLALTGPDSEVPHGSDWYECFGGPPQSGDMIGGWVPGAAPTETPSGSALLVEAGAMIVMQIHYHNTDQPEEDATGLALRWADAEPPRQSFMALRGNYTSQREDGTGLQPGENDEGGEPIFLIPAGANDHSEVMSYTIPGASSNRYQVWAVASHMHYVGVSMRIWVEHASPIGDEPDEECLLQTPFWDFDWQQFYFYDADSGAAPSIAGGDTLMMECIFDNSLDNDAVADLLADNGLDAPQDVGIGEGSLDEMCVVMVGIVEE